MPHAFERYRSIIDDWTAFRESLRHPLPTCVWANPMRIKRPRLKTRLENAGYDCQPVAWHPWALRVSNLVRPGHRFEYLTGLYHVQEEVALTAVELMDVGAGDRVLDLCAAPGNKTSQLSVTMQNRGTVVANDRNLNRLRALRRNTNRMGSANVTITAEDAANYPGAAGRFDAVLADVPCSCEGTTRKHPGQDIRRAEGDAGELSGVQTAILTRALRLCRPGGEVLYSTCTYAPEENEHVIQNALERVSGFGVEARIHPINIDGLKMTPGLSSWNGNSFREEMEHARRIWPHHNDTGGFFVARITRTDDGSDNSHGVGDTNGGVGRHLQIVVDPRAPDAEFGPSTDAPPSEEIAQSDDWLAIVCDRFGLDPKLFRDLLVVQASRKTVDLVNRGHQPPERPVPDSSGMKFIHTTMAYPKMTTQAAMLLGTHADKNVVEVTRTQADEYLHRRDFEVSRSQTDRCTGTGYVLVVHSERVMGIGFFRPATAEASQGPAATIRAMYPKSNALPDGADAFCTPCESESASEGPENATNESI